MPPDAGARVRRQEREGLRRRRASPGTNRVRPAGSAGIATGAESSRQRLRNSASSAVRRRLDPDGRISYSALAESTMCELPLQAASRGAFVNACEDARTRSTCAAPPVGAHRFMHTTKNFLFLFAWGAESRHAAVFARQRRKPTRLATVNGTSEAPYGVAAANREAQRSPARGRVFRSHECAHLHDAALYREKVLYHGRASSAPRRPQARAHAVPARIRARCAACRTPHRRLRRTKGTPWQKNAP